jgi:DNA modification methylase
MTAPDSRPPLYGDAVRWGLIHADAPAMLKAIPDRSVDLVLTDPPYGIGIVRQSWDRPGVQDRPGQSATEAFQHWTTRWATEVHRILKPGGHLLAFGTPRTAHRLTAGIEDAGLEIRDQVLWLFGSGVPKSRRMPDGNGVALKPAYEPVVVGRVPFAGSTQANIDRWGTGALNVDAGRVGSERYWPANVALSHAPDCPAVAIDYGGPSRLFYCAKASTREREAGCERLPLRETQLYTGKRRSPRLRRNLHPTVKPVDLLRWLVRLAAPEGALILDPFCGSGSTGIAAMLEGRGFIGIERESTYVEIARARLTHWAQRMRP